MAGATTGGTAGEYRLTQLALTPSADAADGRSRCRPACGRGRAGVVCLPGPHPAVRPLLAAGWRVAEFDLYMATEPGLLDPGRVVPSPALV